MNRRIVDKRKGECDICPIQLYGFTVGVGEGVGVGFGGSSGSAVGPGVGVGEGVAFGEGRFRGVAVGTLEFSLSPCRSVTRVRARPEITKKTASSNGPIFLIIRPVYSDDTVEN